MPAAIEAVEEVFRFQGEGLVHNVPRRRAVGKSTVLHLMGAAVSPPLDRIGFKAYTTGPSGARFVINLYRESSGELDAVIDAGRLGQLRTGAASGVSAKYMARDDAKIAAIIGSGYQARTQLEAIAHVRRLSKAYVFSRSPENRAAFAAEMSDKPRSRSRAGRRPPDRLLRAGRHHCRRDEQRDARRKGRLDRAGRSRGGDGGQSDWRA